MLPLTFFAILTFDTFGLCVIVMYSNKYVFDIHPAFSQIQNPCNFLNDESLEGVFCYVHKMTFGKHFTMGLVPRTTMTSSPTLLRGLGQILSSITNGQFNQSYLHNETSIKTQRTGFEVLPGCYECEGDERWSWKFFTLPLHLVLCMFFLSYNLL